MNLLPCLLFHLEQSALCLSLPARQQMQPLTVAPSLWSANLRSLPGVARDDRLLRSEQRSVASAEVPSPPRALDVWREVLTAVCSAACSAGGRCCGWFCQAPASSHPATTPMIRSWRGTRAVPLRESRDQFDGQRRPQWKVVVCAALALARPELLIERNLRQMQKPRQLSGCKTVDATSLNGHLKTHGIHPLCSMTR